MYETALKHLSRWRAWKIFTEDNISRMDEVELTSEFAVYMLQGISARNRPMLDRIYDERDSHYPERKEVERRFDIVMNAINDAFGNDLPRMLFRRKTLFYGFFAILYEIQFGGNSISVRAKARKISNQQISALRQIDEDLKEKKEIVPLNVIEATARQTTNMKSRGTLFNYLRDRIDHA